MKAVVLDLEGKIADAGQQDAFVKALTDLITAWPGLKGVIAFENQCYQMELAAWAKQTLRHAGKSLKEAGIVQVGEEKAGCQAVQDLFGKRMKALILPSTRAP